LPILGQVTIQKSIHHDIVATRTYNYNLLCTVRRLIMTINKKFISSFKKGLRVK